MSIQHSVAFLFAMPPTDQDSVSCFRTLHKTDGGCHRDLTWMSSPVIDTICCSMLTCSFGLEKILCNLTFVDWIVYEVGGLLSFNLFGSLLYACRNNALKTTLMWMNSTYTNKLHK